MGGGGDFRAAGIFFSLPDSLYDFFLGHSMNIFLGLIGVDDFFSLALIFFCNSPAPPPISFLMVRPLLQFLYFSRPPPPRATCIVPDARPRGTFENQHGRH